MITPADFFPSSLYFKALDVPEGTARDEMMVRRGAKVATLCRAAEALLRVAKTLRDSDRHGLAFDQTTLLEAATTDVEGRADALVCDIRAVSFSWLDAHAEDTGRFVYAQGGWVPPVRMPSVPPTGGRLGTFIVDPAVKSGGVTPADFAAAASRTARLAGGMA